MATYTQIPAELDIEVGAGDDLSILLDFDISLTGYTFVSKVVQAYSGTETTVTCTNTDLANGQVTISLTDTQITSIGVGTHTWYFQWTVSSASRRVLAGNFIVKAK